MFREADIRPQGELVFVDEFEVRINRKNMKTMRMRVAPPDGHVEVNVPYWIDVDDVKRFVHDNRDRIRRKQSQMKDSPQVRAETASEEEKRFWKQLVAASAPVLVERWSPVLGVVPGKLAYRNMRSRWGSCQPGTGRICINTRLALYPSECLEYVVVHELCHLREPGHTRQFWNLVESCLPDYRRAYNLLKR